MRSVPTYTDPKLQDAKVQELNTLLLASGHIEFAFPIVHMGYNKDGDTYPSVYRNDGSFKNEMLFPDNKVKSFTFFEFNGADDENDENGTVYDLSLLYWGNLQRMNPTKLYDFTSEIIQDLLIIFKNNDCFDISFETEDVFNLYSMYLEEKRQTLMRPNTAFRINLKVRGIVCE